MKFRDWPEIEMPREFENTDHWADTSWHNDATASVECVDPTAHGNTVVVWVYDDDPAKREFEGVKKFVVCLQPGNAVIAEPIESHEFDTISEVLSKVEELLKTK